MREREEELSNINRGMHQVNAIYKVSTDIKSTGKLMNMALYHIVVIYFLKYDIFVIEIGLGNDNRCSTGADR